MFNKKNLTAYYFIDQINESTISTISKFNNISLIYLNQNDLSLNIEDFGIPVFMILNLVIIMFVRMLEVKHV
jgi:hypothetical protein